MTLTKSYVKYENLKKKKYYIHNNGVTPFKVKILKDAIIASTNYCEKGYNYRIFKLTKFLGYWKGVGSEYTGSTILIRINFHKYLYIGPEIFTFNTDDKIYDFHSYIGTNDIPYPVGLGRKNIYFFFEKTYVNNKDFKMKINEYNLDTGDISRYYYGHVNNNCIDIPETKKKEKLMIRSKSKKIKHLKLFAGPKDYF